MGWMKSARFKDLSREASGECLDLGCGPRKEPGWYGVDMHPYEGVDQVLDLDQDDWQMGEARFDYVKTHHVVEHIAYIPHFLNGIHHISRKGCVVEIETPHCSCVSSRQDPTHSWHLGMF